MKTVSVVAFVVCLLCSSGAGASKDAQSPKQVVLAFYKLALVDFQPKEAFARYASPDFVEHSVDCPGGTAQSTVDFLSNLIKTLPQPKWEIVRVIAEGDMVFLHVRFTPSKEAAPVVVGEIFRVRGGKLAEHWDIIQHVPADSGNPNSVF